MNLNIDEVTREADRNASLLRRAVIDAGRAIMAFYSRNFAVGFKDDRSPLTEADMASHHVILRRLSELPVPLGYLPVLSEEGGLSDISQRSEWTAWWLIDPLDGTKEFVKRNGEFTVNIAMIVRRRPGGPGEPLAGWVYAPVPDILYEGIPGRPALKWDKAEEGAAGVHSLPVEEPHTPPRIVVSRSHLTPETETAIQAMSRYFGSGDPVNCGSSLKLCRIAEGMAEFYPRPGSHHGVGHRRGGRRVPGLGRQSRSGTERTGYGIRKGKFAQSVVSRGQRSPDHRSRGEGFQ